MSLRTRIDHLERRENPGGLPCRGCGWRGLILTLNEYIDAEGRAVEWEDGDGNFLSTFPDVPSCDLCKHQIKFILFRSPVAGDGPAGRAFHEP